MRIENLARLCFVVLVALQLGACSQAPQRDTTEEADVASPPDISLSAAPGVALRYAYQFNIADKKISEIQERHASTCERLTLAKCRITGMAYTVDRNDIVRASLGLKLDPAIARQFGKQATGDVVAAGGDLDGLQIDSSDEGQRKGDASANRQAAENNLADLEKRLATANDDNERTMLGEQIATLRSEIASSDETIRDADERLANTPMEFTYYGDGGAPGFRGNPIREAWHLFLGTVIALVGLALKGLAVAIPLLAILALVVAFVRLAPVRRVIGWFHKSSRTDEE